MRTPTLFALILLGVAPSLADRAASAGTSMLSNPRAERLANNTYTIAQPKTGVSRPLLCRIIRCVGDRGERR